METCWPDNSNSSSSNNMGEQQQTALCRREEPGLHSRPTTAHGAHCIMKHLSQRAFVFVCLLDTHAQVSPSFTGG